MPNFKTLPLRPQMRKLSLGQVGLSTGNVGDSPFLPLPNCSLLERFFLHQINFYSFLKAQLKATSSSAQMDEVTLSGILCKCVFPDYSTRQRPVSFSSLCLSSWAPRDMSYLTSYPRGVQCLAELIPGISHTLLVGENQNWCHPLVSDLQPL
jgi:hypothetical protein